MTPTPPYVELHSFEMSPGADGMLSVFCVGQLITAEHFRQGTRAGFSFGASPLVAERFADLSFHWVATYPQRWVPPQPPPGLTFERVHAGLAEIHPDGRRERRRIDFVVDSGGGVMNLGVLDPPRGSPVPYQIGDGPLERPPVSRMERPEPKLV